MKYRKFQNINENIDIFTNQENYYWYLIYMLLLISIFTYILKIFGSNKHAALNKTNFSFKRCSEHFSVSANSFENKNLFS